MNKFLKVALVVALAFCVSVPVYAASNIYKDRYTVENSAGTWTKSGSQIVKGTLWGLGEKTTIISNTPATLTTADSGRTFIVDGGGPGATGATIVTMTLPPATAATTGMYFTFISGDGSGIVVRSSDLNFVNVHSTGNVPTSDILLWGLNGWSGTTGQVTRYAPATKVSVRLKKYVDGGTGTRITVHSYGMTTSSPEGYWYVETTGTATPTTLLSETRATNPNSGK